MVNIKELKKYQKPIEEDDFFTSRIYRKFSIFLTWVFIKLGVGANLVTFIGFIVDLLAIYMIFTSHWIIAGFLVQLFIIIDCVDGEVARYYKNIKKIKKEKKYGEYLDEILGIIGFSLLIFFSGYLLDNLWAGFSAMFALFMLNLTAARASHIFPEKKKIAKKLRKRFFGKIRGVIGFTADIQRTLISFTLFFHTEIFLWIYAVVGNFYWLIKFWIYRKE